VKDSRIIVVAKAPVAGEVKTRLCPPCTPDEAARIAKAALEDTIAAAEEAGFADRVLAVHGRADGWERAGWRVVAQRGDDFGSRLQHVWDDVGGPAIQVAMDTPHVAAADYRSAWALLDGSEHDALLGPALDGGWWLLGLRRSHARLFDGVPMGTARTGRAQLDRLGALGLRVGMLPVVRDLDTFTDAEAIAASYPASRTALEVTHVSQRIMNTRETSSDDGGSAAASRS
jgi:rSAM/selenodomain-associated transferase 1